MSVNAITIERLGDHLIFMAIGPVDGQTRTFFDDLATTAMEWKPHDFEAWHKCSQCNGDFAKGQHYDFCPICKTSAWQF